MTTRHIQEFVFQSAEEAFATLRGSQPGSSVKLYAADAETVTTVEVDPATGKRRPYVGTLADARPDGQVSVAVELATVG